MQALYFSENTVKYRTDYPKPKLQAGEALLKISLSGICRTDLEISKGYAAKPGIRKVLLRP